MCRSIIMRRRLLVIVVSLILTTNISACVRKNSTKGNTDDGQSMVDSQMIDQTSNSYETLQKNSCSLNVAMLSSACMDDIPSTNTVEEYSYWTYDQCNMHARKNAPQTCRVVFEGREYLGEYQYSLLEYFNTYESDVYTFEGGDFAVKADSTDVVRIRFLNDRYGDHSIEECQDRAIEIASKYISVEDYKLTVDDSRPSEMEDSAGLYAFHFRRYIDNTPTCSGLDIIFSSDGELIWFEQFMVDEFTAYMANNTADTVVSVKNVLESPAASDMVNNTIKQQYPDSVSNRVLGKSIVILPDNQLGEVFTVEISFENTENQNETQIMKSQTIVILYVN